MGRDVGERSEGSGKRIRSQLIDCERSHAKAPSAYQAEGAFYCLRQVNDYFVPDGVGAPNSTQRLLPVRSGFLNLERPHTTVAPD
jgi:hypothetical protein